MALYPRDLWSSFSRVVQFYQIAPGSCKPKFALLTKLVVAHRLINPRAGFTDYEFLNCLGTTIFKAQQ
jgi:hypothetical protein